MKWHKVDVESEEPGGHYPEYCNDAWQHHFYMTKRRASVRGDAITIVAMPDELQEHIGELGKVIVQNQ